MTRGTRPGISKSSPEMDEIVDAMRACHKALTGVMIRSKIGGPAYEKAGTANEALLDLVEELTGERSQLLR